MIESLQRAHQLKRSQIKCRLLMLRRLSSVTARDPIVVEPMARGLIRFLAANPGLKRFVVHRIVGYYNPALAGCPIDSLQRYIRSLTDSNANSDANMSSDPEVDAEQPHRKEDANSISRKRRRNAYQRVGDHKKTSPPHNKNMHIDTRDK